MFATVFRREARSWACLTAAAISRSEGPLLTWTPGLLVRDLALSLELLAMKDRLILSGWRSLDFLR